MSEQGKQAYALITGASSGIGAAIAREYARRGKPLTRMSAAPNDTYASTSAYSKKPRKMLRCTRAPTPAAPCHKIPLPGSVTPADCTETRATRAPAQPITRHDACPGSCSGPLHGTQQPAPCRCSAVALSTAVVLGLASSERPSAFSEISSAVDGRGAICAQAETAGAALPSTLREAPHRLPR